jgi:hypothetical protein
MSVEVSSAPPVIWYAYLMNSCAVPDSFVKAVLSTTHAYHLLSTTHRISLALAVRPILRPLQLLRKG